MNTLVSFIMPIFNRATIVLETLKSIQNQTHNNWECIIVDDHSLDNTTNIIANYIQNDNRFKLYKRPNHLIKGANSCRNFAITKAKGNFIQLFDSDDFLDKNFLKIKIDKFIENPTADAILCGFNFFKDDKKITNSKWNFKEKENLFKQYLLKEKVLYGVVFLWKSSFFKKLYFNEKLTRAHDLDSIFRVFNSNTFNFEIVSKELIHIRLHENSITSNYKKGKIEDINSEFAVRKNILENNPFKGDVKIQNKLIFFCLNTIKKYLISNHNKSYFKSLFGIKKVSLGFKVKLFFIGLNYIITKRGLTKYSNTIKALK